MSVHLTDLPAFKRRKEVLRLSKQPYPKGQIFDIDVSRTSRNLILFLVIVLSLGTRAFAADVSMNISGTEQLVSGAWDTGRITIAFGDSAANHYSETLVYGQFSSSASIASAFAAMFSRDYIASGLCAHATGSSISFHLKGAANFGLPNITNPSTSFSFATTGWHAMPTISWAMPTAITYGTVLSAAQLNATAWAPNASGVSISLPGTFAYTPAIGTMVPAGTDTLSVTFTPTDATDYGSVTQTVSLLVNKAVPTITWATPAAVPYGTALGPTQLDPTASTSGSFVYSPTAGTVLSAGSQELSATFTPTDTADYNTVTATVTLTVSTTSGPWIINTVAGNGLTSPEGDGSLATGASLSFPTGVAVDAAGNLYIAEEEGGRIRKVTASSRDISTVAGGGTLLSFGSASEPATSVELYQPAGIAVDASGNLYIAAPGEELVFKVTASTGAISTVAGGGPPITTVGAPIGDGGPATSATLSTPSAIAVDASGNIYIADTGSNRIRKVTISTGNISTVAGNGPNGSYGGYSGDGGAATSSALYFPQGVALDSAGNIYIADTKNNRIRKVAITGTISTVAGGGSGCSQQTNTLGDGCPATSAELNSPMGVTVDSTGNIFISDYGSERVREVAVSTGLISTVAGDGTGGYSGDGIPAISAELYYPDGLAVDTTGNVYIADSGNGRIRQVSGTKATPSVTWQTPFAITYGTALSSAQLNASSNVQGNYTYTPALGAVLTAGAHVLSVTFTPTDTIDYNIVTATVTLTVNQATPIITWGPPANIAYGTPLSTTQLDATSNVQGNYTYTPALGAVLAVGSHTLSVTLTPADTTDYASATVTAYITVAQGTGIWDSGTITLTVNNGNNNNVVATTNYGEGSTPSSIAEQLAANVSANSIVNVTAVDDAIYIEAKGSGSASNYPYSLQTTSYDSTIFGQPSFLNPAVSGTLAGGANQNTAGSAIYSFTVPSGGYDGTGNLLNYTDSVMGTWDFSYDTLNRLAGASQSQSANQPLYYCWGYDPFGNRKLQASSSVAFTSGSPTCSGGNLPTIWANYNTIANNNQFVNTSQATGGVAYDAAGNVLSDGVNQYLYDGGGHICAVATPSIAGGTVMTGYIYDADGQRVAKGSITAWSCDPTVSGFTSTNDYVLGPSGEQVTEMGMDSNNGMAWEHTNVYAVGKLIATYDNNGVHFYLNDPLGTRRAQTDYAGVLEQTCSNLPFGDSLACSGSAQYPTEHHFTGKERDSESGNDYFGARYYASSMGRFMSPDWADKPEAVPYSDLTNPQSLNLYGYVNNNPLSKADKDGHCPECMVWADEAMQYIEDSPVGQQIENWGTQGVAAGGALLGAALSGGGNAYPSYYHGEFDNGVMLRNSGESSSSQPAPSAQPNSASPNPGPDGPYKRPNNATTQEQRDAVQGKPCATCGATGQKNNADHKDPLVEQHYRGGIDKDKMRSPDAVQPQCQNCSNQQGGYLRTFSQAMKKLFGFN